jgi:hypothetical protein
MGFIDQGCCDPEVMENLATKKGLTEKVRSYSLGIQRWLMDSGFREDDY